MHIIFFQVIALINDLSLAHEKFNEYLYHFINIYYFIFFAVSLVLRVNITYSLISFTTHARACGLSVDPFLSRNLQNNDQFTSTSIIMYVDFLARRFKQASICIYLSDNVIYT